MSHQRLMYRIRNLLAASILVSANLFIFGTFAVYHGNVDEFEVGYLSLFSVLAVPCVALLGVLLLLGVLCPSRAFNGYTSALFAFGILLWVQGSFLKRNYGVFDGRGINWEQSSLPAWVDASIWVVALAAAIRFAPQIAGLVSYMSWILIALQSILMLVLGSTSQGELYIKEYTPQGRIPTELLKYSSSQNIVHIVLDSFQTDIFWDLVLEESLEDDFRGFVLFKENVGVAPYTTFSVPAIFSGRIYDGAQPLSSYYQDSIRGGFPSRLYDHGYIVNLVPRESMQSSKYTNYYRIQTVYRGSLKDIVQANAVRLLDVAWFRQSPHWIRKRIYNDNNWFITSLVSQPSNVSSFREKLFFREYIESIEVGHSKPAYHFLHLMPPHPPYVTERNGSYARRVLPNTRENYKNEAKAILQLFLDLLDRLQKLGLYDSSLILLHGDHGSQISPVVDGRLIDTCLPRMPALLTVKLPSSSGPLQVSQVQTSLLDVPATVMKTIGLSHEVPGNSSFEIDSAKLRKRPFVIYHARRDPPEITKYSIYGSVFDQAACREEGHARVPKSRPKYEYGTEIKFGLMGNAESFVGSGWSAAKSRGRWSSGDRSSLVFRIDPPESDLVLKTKFTPYIRGEKAPKQTIQVFANGNKVDEWSATEYRSHRFQAIIPERLIRSSELKIEFRFLNAVSPRLIGTGGDPRKLAVVIYSAALDLLVADQ